ncbi:hypothetical protein L195_g063459, partial [Trifolium pratense]
MTKDGHFQIGEGQPNSQMLKSDLVHGNRSPSPIAADPVTSGRNPHLEIFGRRSLYIRAHRL